LSDIDFPFYDKLFVNNCGHICLGRNKLISAQSLPAKLSAS